MYTSLYEKIVPFCEKNKVGWNLLMHDTNSFCFEFGLENSPFECEKDFILALHFEENSLLIYTFMKTLILGIPPVRRL
jgi:hypothetical protein